ncbi:hypothetical protein GCM10020216_087770 [Nonomuraea helvata]
MGPRGQELRSDAGAYFDRIPSMFTPTPKGIRSGFRDFWESLRAYAREAIAEVTEYLAPPRRRH